MMADEQVSSLYNAKFDKCDRHKIKVSICNRIQAINQYEGVISILGDEVTQQANSLSRSTDLPNVSNRVGKRRPTLPQDDDVLPSNKLQKTFHGAKNL